MNYISSVSYALVVNGGVTNDFLPERGLRQGDPLSPYLFLICTEGLSTLLVNDKRNGVILGLQASRFGPRVSHLFFADYSLVFLKANTSESERVKHQSLQTTKRKDQQN